ncbi:flagellar hook-associated 2 domain protein [Denitrovibrio acetiphilus DSM 12809]|uniref:Flagellar hook-associated protein 2 n=1 Tax=Denitrovibrio acetiphilus (strain DSM 12809 / NBRC 114555 / N2460) TaxID=522772 RepID=D4H874_DENA2|nr:flagellar filament capping protein FliD [Denitrovibrio acetiphilus]ADD68223.1 flagellar hook-associated 2 domain protein [Denitrovibrio acetiphilus DSM 12809]
MAGIQVGGIVSGMDTNALVEQLMQQAQVPVDKLYGELSYKGLEEEVYENVDNMLGNLTSDLLTLRLESTFKTKTTTSTNEGVATATATTDAAVGTHTLQVDQLANNSTATSAYTRFALSKTGANVTGVKGLSADYLQGVSKTTIQADGTDYLATTEMTLDGLGRVAKSSGATIDSGSVDNYGRLLTDFDGDFTIGYTDSDGNAQTLTINETFGSTDVDIDQAESINDVAARLEFYLNEGMNDSMGTNAVQYLAVRAQYDSDADTWNMAMYETTVDDYNISVFGTDAGTLRDELGFAESYTPTTSTTGTLTKYHIADTLENLQDEVFSAVSGVVAGATFTLSGTLTEGSFTIAQDSTLKVGSATYTSYTSSQVSGGAGLDVSTSGLENAGFTKTISDSANGYFTINDVKIEIEDYSKLSVNDLLGKINGSGAGVTASYDSVTDTFNIRSNTTGSSSVSLGAYGDTSNLLSVMNLSGSSDRTFTQGTTSGSISTSSDLLNAGLTVLPTSGTFTINGVSIYVDAGTDTIQDVIEKVNNSGAGVTMAYDTTSDKVTLRSDGIEPIEVGGPNDSSNLLKAFNLTDNPIVSKSIGTTGQKAILTVDGQTYVRESNTVSDILNGVTFTLNSASATPTTIDVSVDTDKAVDAFATFIAHYNEVMQMLDIPSYDSDDKDDYMGYLTDTDKESMTDDDISEYMENYEKYNKYDIIRRSSELKNMDNTLRSMFFSVRTGVSGSINDMSDIGIEVAGDDITEQTKGYLVSMSTDHDEIVEALKENADFLTALTDKPDEVYTFFAQSSDLDETDANYNNEIGWSRYLSKMIDERYTSDTGMIGAKLGTSGTIYSEMSRLESRIETQEERVESQLERYWAQFTAMEQAISDAQASANSFTSASSSS